MPFRRLDDRIRELCSALIAAREHHEVASAVSELRTALRQHTETLRKLAAAKLVKPIDQEPAEGRCQRLTQPDGRVFWSFRWSPPIQNLGPAIPNCYICNRPVELEPGKASQDGKVVHESCYMQRPVSAPQEPPDAQRAA